MYQEKSRVDKIKYISLAGMIGGFLLILLGIGLI